MATKSKRVPVMVDKAVYNKFKRYSEKPGASISFLIREALSEWAETVIAAREESLDEAATKVVCIDRDGNIHTFEKTMAATAGADN